ncbi:hypothetical protein GCM10027294_00010 [Marinactinospora endophytica]
MIPGVALLTRAEVAALFQVDPKTVTRWAKAGRLTSVCTPGGHRRYPADQLPGLLTGETGAYGPPAAYDHDGERLLSGGEVASLLRLQAGKVHDYLAARGVAAIRPAGRGRCYRETAVRALAEGAG